MESQLKQRVLQQKVALLEGERLSGSGIFIRFLNLNDVSEGYVAWLNDPFVNRYLESRFKPHTLEGTQTFVESCSNNNSVFFWGIFDTSSGCHIGNIKLDQINYFHGFGWVGLLLGDRNYWGKGIGTEAIRLVSNFSFETLGLRRLVAGAYATNLASIKAFQRVGFRIEGVSPRHWLCEGAFVDGISLGMHNPREK